MCECITFRRRVSIEDGEKKKAEAETVLKTENLSSSIDSGIFTPCFRGDSTSLFERPFPESSFKQRC